MIVDRTFEMHLNAIFCNLSAIQTQ